MLDAGIDSRRSATWSTAATFDDARRRHRPDRRRSSTRVAAPQSDTKDAIDDAVADRGPTSRVDRRATRSASSSAAIFDFLINAVNGLLLMSVIVALIGIVNTLSLSILERRRELGLLRVMGMTDQRVQRMVRLESVLIAALGTVTGIVLGLAVGWGLVAAHRPAHRRGHRLRVPGARGCCWSWSLGIVLGVLASFIPARRSTRLEVLDAIAST